MKTLKIYQTSDIHTHIYPTNYVDECDYGLSKIATLIKTEAKDNPKLIIDSGDFIQGSPLAYYTRTKEPDFSLYQGLNSIGYDAITLGNHEFNYGQSYLCSQISGFKNDILCANISGLPFTTIPYKIYQFDDLKVGVIGLTTSYVPHWEQPENIVGLTFNDPIETYAKYEQELQNECDIIVVNYHGGFEASLDNPDKLEEANTGENIGSKLASVFDSIDIILSGHQHRQFAQVVNNKLCVQPSFFGKTVNEITIDIAKKEIVDYRQISTADYQPDNDILNLYKQLNDNCNKFLDTNLTINDTDLSIDDIHQARLKSHPFVSLLGQVFQEEMDSDFAAISIYDSAIGFSKNITIREVCRNYPFANTILKVELSGEEIIEAIYQSNQYYTLEDETIIINPHYIYPKLKHYNYDMFYGLSYTVVVKEGRNQITNVLVNNQPIDMHKTYTIAISNYRFNNREDYPVYAKAKVLEETSTEAAEILINYLTAHQDIKFTNKIDYQIKK